MSSFVSHSELNRPVVSASPTSRKRSKWRRIVQGTPLVRLLFVSGMIMGATWLQPQMLMVHRGVLQNASLLGQMEDQVALPRGTPTSSGTTLNHTLTRHHRHRYHKNNATTSAARSLSHFIGSFVKSDETNTSKQSNSTFNTSSSSSFTPFPFEVDELCGGCRYLQSRHGSCGKIIEQHANDHNTTLASAAHNALDSKAAPEECRACLQCDDQHRQYWRPDRAAPAVHKATTHYLTTIPEETHRIPRDVLATKGYETITRFFEQKHNRYPAKRYLFEYNPSIVPMPVNEYQSQLIIDGVIPTYAASYRVATQQSCFPANTTLQMIGGSWEKRPPSISYLGIALLDKDLKLLADVVVNLPKKFGAREDYRLFVLHKRLYLSSYVKLTPLHIGTVVQPPYDRHNETQPAENVFPSPLRLTIGSQPLFISNDKELLKTAKNLNYFVDPDTNLTMVELNPAGDLMSKLNPHNVQPVHLTLPTQGSNVPHYQLYGKANITSELPASDRPSFYTVDELALAKDQGFYESPYVADRGSACCVEFKRENQSLLVGISHVKIPWGRRKMQDAGLTPNQYLSRFYAMEPTAPYRTVAMSGYICLSSFPTQSRGNPLAARSPHDCFTIGSLTLDCPAIHFVTGMTEKVDDPSTLIIAYGVGDCTSWFVEVAKQEVVDLLFNSPKVKTGATLSF